MPAATAPLPPRRRPLRPPPAAAPAAVQHANGAGVLAKPPVRKMARDLGVDLTALAGTGPGGSITREDVQQAADTSAAKPVPGLAVFLSSRP